MKNMMKIGIVLVFLLLSINFVSAEYINPIENTTLDEFKDDCVEVSYYDLNDDLVNQPVKLHGVISVIDSDSMLFNVNDDPDQQVYVQFKSNDKFNEYEGKEATIYCLYQGTFDVPFVGEQLEFSLADIELT